jgi:hypothetical protein
MLIYIAARFRVKVMKVTKIVTFFNKVFRSKLVMFSMEKRKIGRRSLLASAMGCCYARPRKK